MLFYFMEATLREAGGSCFVLWPHIKVKTIPLKNGAPIPAGGICVLKQSVDELSAEQEGL